MVGASACQSEMVGGAFSIPGKSPSQDKNAGSLENSKKPAKFPNHSQK
jgi:hypothetical protein